MRELAAASWELYRDAVNEGTAALVRPSIPILFFGGDEKYISSPLKVITVGLNLSRLEFPRGDPFLRFSAARQIDPQQPALDAHLEALRGSVQPSSRSSTGSLRATYEGTATSTALHTDICSPLATDPTWSRLGKVGAALTTAGVELLVRKFIGPASLGRGGGPAGVVETRPLTAPLCSEHILGGVVAAHMAADIPGCGSIKRLASVPPDGRSESGTRRSQAT